MATAEKVTKKVTKTIEVEEDDGVILRLSPQEARFLITTVGSTSGYRLAPMFAGQLSSRECEDLNVGIYETLRRVGVPEFEFHGCGLWPIQDDGSSILH